MRQLFALALAATLAGPLAAQDTPGDEGFDLMQEGSRLILRGLLDELGPALEDMEALSDEMREALQDLTSDMGPALREIMGLIDEVGHYEVPEVLDNGDIIIRRKPDAPPYTSPETDDPQETIDL